MDAEPDDPEFEEIVRLIRDEERAGMEFFRRRDFRRKMESCVGDLPGRGHSRAWPWKLALPAVAALLLIAAWAVLRQRQVPFAGAGEAPAVFVAGLEGLPGMAEVASRQALPEAAVGEAPDGPPSIRGALARASHDELENVPPDPLFLKVHRLTLEQKMTILFKDRAIERVLVLFRKKSEEV